MKKIEKREHSLYGIVYPHDMRFIKNDIDRLASVSNEIYSQINPNRLVRVEFDFKLIRKSDVFDFMVKIAKLKYGPTCSIRKLAKLLAMFTNLEDNPDRSKRINAILRGYKYHKNHTKH